MDNHIAGVIVCLFPASAAVPIASISVWDGPGHSNSCLSHLTIGLLQLDHSGDLTGTKYSCDKDGAHFLTFIISATLVTIFYVQFKMLVITIKARNILGPTFLYINY